MSFHQGEQVRQSSIFCNTNIGSYFDLLSQLQLSACIFFMNVAAQRAGDVLLLCICFSSSLAVGIFHRLRLLICFFFLPHSLSF